MFEQFLLSHANRIANYPILVAIRSALILSMPFMLLGSLALLLNSFPLPAYREFMQVYFGDNWRLLGNVIQNGTVAIMSLPLLFSIGQQLAEQYNAGLPIVRANPALVGLVSFACFFCLLRPDMDVLPKHWLGVSGLLVALLTGIAATRLFFFFFRFRESHLYLPGGTTDIIIPQVFNSLIPATVTVLVFACAGTLLQVSSGASIYDIVYQLIRMPFDAIDDGLDRGFLYIGVLQTLWFFGIHGANVLDPITHDVYGAAILANETAAAAGLALPHVVTKTFMDTFVFMGGSGASLCLTGALLLFGKAQADRKIGIISLLPGIFNINEVLLFGLPLVFNPLMFIPFIMAPLLLAVVSYLLVVAGFVPGTSAAVEWTTPVLLNGYLTTGSLRGPMLQLLNLGIGILVYAPFVWLSNRINTLQLADSFQRLLRHACSASDTAGRSTDLRNNTGSLARSLVIDLQNDLANGQGLFLEFQPQISATSGQVLGVEALLRWRHRAYGLIPAPITISLAEESGLIRPLGLWIFDSACQVRRQWLDAGVESLIMAVNVSALQLESTFPRHLAEILGRHNVPAQVMEVEVTESGALDADQPENVTLAELHAMGLPLALDDFGMGHSSLKYLKQFPVTGVKIDGVIIRDIVTNTACRDIVAALTGLCKARNMVSVAEFVETEEQVAILRTMGCDLFQGYRYSPSLPAPACLEYIMKTNLGK